MCSAKQMCREESIKYIGQNKLREGEGKLHCRGKYKAKVMLILVQTGALFEMLLHILGTLDWFVQFWKCVGQNIHVFKTIF